MAVKNATIRAKKTDVTKNVPSSNGLTDTTKTHVATLELAASSSGQTIDFGRIPSNARLLPSSRIYFDDLATSGSPTLDLGLAAVNNNTATSDDDCINDGLVVSAVSVANVGVQVVKDFANAGKMAWEILGLSSDPGGLLDVTGILRDAATTQTGTITLDLHYKVD